MDSMQFLRYSSLFQLRIMTLTLGLDRIFSPSYRDPEHKACQERKDYRVFVVERCVEYPPYKGNQKTAEGAVLHRRLKPGSGPGLEPPVDKARYYHENSGHARKAHLG